LTSELEDWIPAFDITELPLDAVAYAELPAALGCHNKLHSIPRRRHKSPNPHFTFCRPLSISVFHFSVTILHCISSPSKHSIIATTTMPNWSREAVIALVALFATCAPLIALVIGFVHRRRRMQHVQSKVYFNHRLDPSTDGLQTLLTSGIR
jgi:hypothetical protein